MVSGLKVGVSLGQWMVRCGSNDVRLSTNIGHWGRRRSTGPGWPCRSDQCICGCAQLQPWDLPPVTTSVPLHGRRCRLYARKTSLSTHLTTLWIRGRFLTLLISFLSNWCSSVWRVAVQRNNLWLIHREGGAGDQGSLAHRTIFGDLRRVPGKRKTYTIAILDQNLCTAVFPWKWYSIVFIFGL